MGVVKLELPRPSVHYVTEEPLLAVTDMQLQSNLTCPKCSHQAVETMPTDACQFFYDCKGCGERLIMPRGRLLRVLLLRVGAVPADTEQLALLCKREAPRRYRAQEHSERDVLPVEHNSSGSTPRR